MSLHVKMPYQNATGYTQTKDCPIKTQRVAHKRNTIKAQRVKHRRKHRQNKNQKHSQTKAPTYDFGYCCKGSYINCVMRDASLFRPFTPALLRYVASCSRFPSYFDPLAWFSSHATEIGNFELFLAKNILQTLEAH